MTTKPTLLEQVALWWRWQPDEVAQFLEYAAQNKAEATDWIRSTHAETEKMIADGFANVDSWIAFHHPGELYA